MHQIHAGIEIQAVKALQCNMNSIKVLKVKQKTYS